MQLRFDLPLRDSSSFVVPREGIPRTADSTMAIMGVALPHLHKFIMSKEIKNEDSKMTYSFENWEIKTLLQDIETCGHPIKDVNLTILADHGNADYYGTARNPKYKDRRSAISDRIQDFKRRSPQSWLAWVKGYGVTPSHFTLENAAAAERETKKKSALAKDDEAMEEINDKFGGFGVKDNDSFGFVSFEEAPPMPPPPPTPTCIFLPKTPPRNAMAGFATKLKSPDRTYSGNTLATYNGSTSSYFTAEQGSHMPYGSYERPWKFEIVPGFSGRYINDIWVYEEAKQVKSPKEGTQKLSYSGYLFKLQVNPPDVALYSCFLADDNYMAKLCHNGIIGVDELKNLFVVFRGPYIQAFDRVGKGGVIPHQWISLESEETVKTTHANIKPPSEEDESPGPSWAYTVAKVPEGYPLDNRVFSDHDYKVAPYESMPTKTKIPELNNEEALSFHIMWRVALKGTEVLMDESQKLSLAERMKKRREQHKN